jgi:hypothetical protein
MVEPRALIGRVRLVALVGVLAFAFPVGLRADRLSGEPFIRTDGRPQLVYDWSRDRCDSADIPDLPARALRDSHGRIQILISHYVNRRLVGDSFDRLTHPCQVVMGSAGNPSAAAFADRQWLASLYTFDGKVVIALVHDEYQGHLHPGRCPTGIYQPCWYNAVTLAISRDAGASYREARPPNQLVAAIPQPYRPGAGPAGIFAPSNIVRSPTDDYFYVLVREIAYGPSLRGTCVLRTRTPGNPTSWRAWDGNSFSVRLDNPYRMAPGTGRFCQPVAKAEIGEMTESLTFNTRLNRFLLVGASTTPGRGGRVSGVYYSTSDDLIHWDRRRLLLEAPTVHTYGCRGNPIAYPSVIDPSSPSRSFDTSGDHAYLYFTRFNYKHCRQTSDRDLLRVPIVVGEQP